VHLDKALALRPGDPGVRYQLALVAIATNTLETALGILEELVREAPEWLEAHVSLTTVYYRLGRREDGDRQQTIVRRLREEDQARREAAAAAAQQGGEQPD
jgi:predicted Zn-dependent protease